MVEAASSIPIHHVVLGAVAERQICRRACRAAAAWCWGQAVGGVGHTVGVCGAVLGPPRLLQGLVVQPLASLDVCEAVEDSTAPNKRHNA